MDFDSYACYIVQAFQTMSFIAYMIIRMMLSGWELCVIAYASVKWVSSRENLHIEQEVLEVVVLSSVFISNKCKEDNLRES